MDDSATEQVPSVVDRWHAALRNRDLEELLSCYSENAILDTPAASRFKGSPSAVQGKPELRPFLATLLNNAPIDRDYFQYPAFTDGRRVVIEVPPRTPTGSAQWGYVEALEIEGGLIASHTVYWGGAVVSETANSEPHTSGDAVSDS